MRSTEMRALLGSALRFGVVGGANTLVTGVLLSLLSLVIAPGLAYTVVFALGILFSTFMAGRFVYRVEMARAQILQYVAMYIGVYVVGLGVLAVAVGQGLPPGYSGLVVLVTAPLTFLGGLLIVRRTAPGQAVRQQEGMTS
ncbi:GtrA family protein [Cellulomonas cellasea]|uniref:GtrA family protein n=1 Tax=Cellulomonas TaxID=1707 RepID=UPI0011CC2ED7|nr:MULTISPECIES: GtrA family protein [Cellulomonas]MDM8084681.1 GtrA family protein [Cellulomonas cellasea]